MFAISSADCSEQPCFTDAYCMDLNYRMPRCAGEVRPSFNSGRGMHA